MRLTACLALAVAAGAGAQPASHTATRLRVGFVDAPLTVDGATFATSTIPLAFSWALFHPQPRGEGQASYRIVVAPAPTPSDPTPTPMWDTGLVPSNSTGPVPYRGPPLTPDADFEWAVTWTDLAARASLPAVSTFSTALFGEADWQGAAYLSSTNATAGDGGLNAYRAVVDLSPSVVGAGRRVVRARLYIAGLGWWRAWVNGVAVDDHEIGALNEAMARVLYDTADVTALLVPGGCNVLAVQLGHGWWDRESFLGFLGPRQFRALLSVTMDDGTTASFVTALDAGGDGRSPAPTSPASSSTGALPLLFNATAGPITFDDVYGGETYDGTVAAGILGWELCGYAPAAAASAWSPAVAPASTPVSAFNATTSAHHQSVVATRDLEVLMGALTQPAPGVWVYDFGQNGAVVATLSVQNCPPGTVITMQHAELLYPNGSAHNHFGSMAPMLGTYICGGPGAGGPEVSPRAGGGSSSSSSGGLAQRLGAAPGVAGGASNVEGHRYYFSQMGSRYVQLTGFPGVPGEDNVVVHIVRTRLGDSGAGHLSTSSPLLNDIHHAIRASLLSNFMDVPTDCPQRERHGWLGDALVAFDTSSYTVDAAALYTKWLLSDFPDTQSFNVRSVNASGALPNFVPYGFNVSHHDDADPAWGAAAFLLPLWLADLVDPDDAIVLPRSLPWLRAYADHWIANASASNGLLNFSYWGDWAAAPVNGVPLLTPDYPQAFYALSLQAMAAIAKRVGTPADAQRYAEAYANATAAYAAAFYDPATGCVGGGGACAYSSAVYALTLGIVPQGSAAEALIWSHVAAVLNGTSAPYPGRFPGGILTVRFLYPLLDRFGGGWPGVGLGTLVGGPGLEMPSLGYWVGNQRLTTLPEEYNLTNTTPPSFYGVASYNHIMFGGMGGWMVSTVAGLQRVGGGWRSLRIAPPSPVDSGLVGSAPPALSYASASVDTPLGKAAVAWNVPALTAGGGGAGGGGGWGDEATQPVFTVTAVVPTGASATVVVWLTSGGGSGGPVAGTVTESGAVVWAGGAFVPGVAGVTGAQIGDGGLSVVVGVTGGSFAFAAV
jgi:alpha-L-rhamnosidase